MAPFLYKENERLSFRWQHPQFGRVLMLCVGALAVSSIESCRGEACYGQWTRIGESVQKGERLAGFRLGSSVLLVLERAEPLPSLPKMLGVGRGIT